MWHLPESQSQFFRHHPLAPMALLHPRHWLGSIKHLLQAEQKQRSRSYKLSMSLNSIYESSTVFWHWPCPLLNIFLILYCSSISTNHEFGFLIILLILYGSPVLVCFPDNVFKLQHPILIFCHGVTTECNFCHCSLLALCMVMALEMKMVIAESLQGLFCLILNEAFYHVCLLGDKFV